MNRKQRTAIYELAQALKLTQEYVGGELLPRLPGWSWFDALTKHAPEMLEQSLSGTALGVTTEDDDGN